MTKRTFQPRIDSLAPLIGGPKFDIKRPVGLYGRHSAKEQFGNIATGQQTKGQRKIALALGWVEDLLREFYEDLQGISAYRIPMDMRKSYSDLYNAIVRGEIGTVMCYKVDRLFRTKNGEEWELFINACIRSNVKVITTSLPMRVYDLSISSDADDFRKECIDARKYVEDIIKGRLNAARDELGYRGLWAGSGTPVGFYVDLNEKSSTFKQFFIYEPHAELIRVLFKRYRELGGAFNRLAREVEAHQPFFPLFEGIDKLPNIQLIINEARTGYSLGRDGLLSILTNPMYIGLYMYKGQKLENNHPVIVDDETFFYAFDRLSKFDLGGNERETARTRAQGYSSTPEQKIEAFLRGKITSPDYNRFSVSSHQKAYILEQSSHNFNMHVMSVHIALLDTVVSEQLVSRLSMWDDYLKRKKQSGNATNTGNTPVTQTNQAIETRLTEVKTIAQEPVTTIASVDDQIPSLKKRIAKLEINLELDTDRGKLDKWAKELKDKVQELKRLEAKQEAIARSKESKEEAKDLLLRVPEEWEKWKFEQRQRAINLMVESVSVTEEAPHFLTVTIEWKLPSIDKETLHVWKQGVSQTLWTDKEKAILKAHYTQTPIRDMLALIPCRSWSSIKKQAVKMHLSRNSGTPYNVSVAITWQDIQFMREHGIEEDSFDTNKEVVMFVGKGAPKILSLHS